VEDLVARILDGEPATPASDDRIAVFRARCAERGVPDVVTGELAALYAVADGLVDDDHLCLHPCDDPVIFEWWADRELWLGQRHFHTLRWTQADGFALGDAATVAHDPTWVSDTMIGLLRRVLAARDGG
jgi:hypothetical protein